MMKVERKGGKRETRRTDLDAGVERVELAELELASLVGVGGGDSLALEVGMLGDSSLGGQDERREDEQQRREGEEAGHI